MNFIGDKKISLAFIDDLTQLYNHRFISSYMPALIAKAKTTTGKASLFMIDMDWFKKINDTYGHPAGDMVLKEVSKVIKESVGDDGIVARYAGDEFTVLLPDHDEKGSSKVAEAIVRNASSLRLTMKDGRPLSVTLSVGSAVYPDDGATLEDLIDQADQALYAVKRSSKNTVLSRKAVSRQIEAETKLKQAVFRPPFINRKDELQTLKDLYKISEGGKKAAILLAGEAGIGKTRLIEEFSNHLAKEDAIFLLCDFQREEETSPLAGVAELLRVIANSYGPKMQDALNSLSDPEIREIVYLYPRFKELVKERTFKIIYEDRILNLFSGLRKILISISGGKTLVLAIDSLHWANQLTLQFVLILIKSLELTKLLFMGTYRKIDLSDSNNNVHTPLGRLLEDPISKTIFTTIDLKAFTKDMERELVDSIFPGIKLEHGFIENISKISKGNPFILIEILRDLIESGHIRYEKDKWNTTAIETKEIQKSLDGMAKRRFDKLDEETKEVLANASLIGNRFELDILKKVIGRDEGYILELLHRAVSAGLIKSPGLDFDVISFQDRSIKEGLSDTIPLSKSVSLHRKLAEVIEQDYKEELPVQLGRLIYHLHQSKDKAASLKYDDLNQQMVEDYSLPIGLLDFLKKVEESKEAPISIEELLERPLTKVSVKIIKETLFTLRAAVIGTLLYPEDNKLRMELAEKAYAMMVQIFQSDPLLTFSSVEGKLLINGEELRQLDMQTTIGLTFASLLDDHGISSMTFKNGLGGEEFKRFLEYLGKPEIDLQEHGGIAGLVKSEDMPHIKIDEVKYEKASDIAKKTMGIKKGEIGELLPEEEILTTQLRDSLMTKPIEEYSDPKMLRAIGTIAEGLLVSKNDKKTEDIVKNLLTVLDKADGLGRALIINGLNQLSEPLINYEKFHILKILTDGLINRFHKTQESKEFRQICETLQSIANGFINKEKYGEARSIIKHFKEQIGPESARPKDQKMIIEEQLSKITHPKIIEALVAAFRKKVESNYVDIVGVLTELGEYAITPLIGLLTSKEDPKSDPLDQYAMRRLVGAVLKKIGEPAKKALTELLSDQRTYVIENVIEAFGNIGDEDALPALGKFLSNPSVHLRQKCVVALKNIGGSRSLKLLIGALKDMDEDIRRSAASSIIRIADGASIKELQPLLSTSMKGEAEEIIQKIRSKTKDGH